MTTKNTKKAKHTQGEWHVQNHATIRVKGDNPIVIATVSGAGNNEEQAKANAKLIASAPEMLTLLKKLLDTKTLSERSAPELTYEAQDLITKIESV